MFIGHFAPAFAAAAISPRAPKLATLFVAGQLVDWAFFTFAFFGIERMRVEPGATVMVPLDLYHMPYTHSLLGTAAWAIVFTGLVLWARKDAVTASLAGLVVLSHWLLDWLTHRPDLSLMGGDDMHGLGLWNVPLIAIPLELGITIGAFYWYVKATRGPIGPPIILLTVLLAFQAINWFGPSPQTAGPLLYTQALLAFLLATLFAAWVGTTRKHKREVLSLLGPRR